MSGYGCEVCSRNVSHFSDELQSAAHKVSVCCCPFLRFIFVYVNIILFFCFYVHF